ncbi:MAG: mandelate racemase/muconate lactonizing enzyme family protein [Pseudomonadota bacterium]
MKIVSVATHILEHRLDVAFESASARFDARQHLLVEIRCDTGLVGWGECLGPVTLNRASVEAYAPLLIGRDPRETEVLWQRLYHTFRDQGQRGTAITALSGIDIALWDIKGKAFGVPISLLLGGRVRESVAAYATGAFRRDGVDRVQDNAEEAAGHVANGFRAVKIKIGFGLDDDLAVIEAVRAAIGPNTRLMIDANHGYDAIEAIALGNEAARFGIDWFEEPVVPEHLEAYTQVRARQPIPVAGGETWHGRYGFQTPLALGCVDIVQPDICGVGGFTEIRRVIDQADLANVRVIPHVWGTAVQIAASLHVLAALLPAPPRPTPRPPLLEFDRTENPFRQAVVRDPIEAVDGIVAVPHGDGLGIEVTPSVFAEFKPREIEQTREIA